MPDINTIPVPSYEPLNPYNHIFDNLPITGLIERIAVVNAAVDVNTNILAESIGTQGSLANRLAQSINPDGTLKVTAINNAMHSIAEHLDAGGYVRMTDAERAKLSLITPNATYFAINVETISGIIPFIDTTMEIEPSDSIVWRYSGGKLSAETNFPDAVKHVHYYNVVPSTSNYKNYTTTSLATPYREGSLRVYINGVRLNSDNLVYVHFGPGTSWSTFSYTEGTATSGVVTGGDFVLSSTVAASASVIIDFDVLYS